MCRFFGLPVAAGTRRLRTSSTALILILLLFVNWVRSSYDINNNYTFNGQSKADYGSDLNNDNNVEEDDEEEISLEATPYQDPPKVQTFSLGDSFDPDIFKDIPALSGKFGISMDGLSGAPGNEEGTIFGETFYFDRDSNSLVFRRPTEETLTRPPTRPRLPEPFLPIVYAPDEESSSTEDETAHIHTPIPRGYSSGFQNLSANNLNKENKDRSLFVFIDLVSVEVVVNNGTDFRIAIPQSSERYCAPTLSVRNCNLRTAIEYCLEELDWSRTLDCRITLDVNQVQAINLQNYILFSKPWYAYSKHSTNLTRLPVNIYVDAMGVPIRGNGTAFLTTLPSNFTQYGNYSRKERMFQDMSGSSLEMTNIKLDGFTTDTEGVNPNGGAFYIHRLNSFTLRNSIVTNGYALNIGGGLYIDNAKVVTIDNVTFSSNAAITGSSVLMKLVGTVNITGSRFLNNYARSQGAGISIDTAKTVSVTSSLFSENRIYKSTSPPIYGFGGALAVFNVSQSLMISLNRFFGNQAQFGSAIALGRCQNATVTTNNFARNKADIGTVYWISLDMKEPALLRTTNEFTYAQLELVATPSAAPVPIVTSQPSFITTTAPSAGRLLSNQSYVPTRGTTRAPTRRSPSFRPTVFVKNSTFAPTREPSKAPVNSRTVYLDANVANFYGPRWATEALTTLDISPNNLFINQYTSGYQPLATTVTVYDYYRQQVNMENSTFFQILNSDRICSSINDRACSCGFNFENAAVIGRNIVPVVNGRGTFTNLGGQCIPGGHFNATIQAKIFATTILFPLYTPPFIPSDPGEAVPAAPTRLASGIATIHFRPCLRGEKYDSISLTKSTCSICQQSYSFANNLDNTITSCQTCPEAADQCMGENIFLHRDTFRWSFTATHIYNCSFRDSCIGNITWGNSSCLPGYHGPFCSICDANFYNDKSKQKCVSCTAFQDSFVSSPQFTATIIVVFCIAAFYAVYKFVKKTYLNVDGESQEQDEALDIGPDGVVKNRDQVLHRMVERAALKASWVSRAKIVLVTYQIATQAPVIFSVTFPPAFQKFLDAINVVNLDVFSIMPVSCFFPGNTVTWFGLSHKFNYLSLMRGATLLPVGVFCLALGIYILAMVFYIFWIRDPLRRKREESRFRIQCSFLFIFVSYFMLPGLTHIIYKTFSCFDVDPYGEGPGKGTLLLKADLGVSCTDQNYKDGRQWAVISAIAYTAGLPMIYCYLLWKSRHEIEHRGALDRTQRTNMIRDRQHKPIIRYFRMMEAISFMFVPYEPQFWFWEIIEITRRLLLTSILSLLFEGTSTQITFSILISLAYIKFYNVAKPYVLPTETILAEIGQFQVFFTYFIAAIVKNKSFGDVVALNGALDLILIAVNGMTGTYFLYTIAVDLIEGAKKHSEAMKIALMPKVIKIAPAPGRTDEDAKVARMTDEEYQLAKSAHQNKPVQLLYDQWKDKIDMSDPEDVKFFKKVLRNLSDEHLFRLQAMIYTNIVSLRRRLPNGERYVIYSHDAILIGDLEDITEGDVMGNTFGVNSNTELYEPDEDDDDDDDLSGEGSIKEAGEKEEKEEDDGEKEGDDEEIDESDDEEQKVNEGGKGDLLLIEGMKMRKFSKSKEEVKSIEDETKGEMESTSRPESKEEMAKASVELAEGAMDLLKKRYLADVEVDANSSDQGSDQYREGKVEDVYSLDSDERDELAELEALRRRKSVFSFIPLSSSDSDDRHIRRRLVDMIRRRRTASRHAAHKSERPSTPVVPADFDWYIRSGFMPDVNYGIQQMYTDQDSDEDVEFVVGSKRDWWPYKEKKASESEQRVPSRRTGTVKLTPVGMSRASMMSGRNSSPPTPSMQVDDLGFDNPMHVRNKNSNAKSRNGSSSNHRSVGDVSDYYADEEERVSRATTAADIADHEPNGMPQRLLLQGSSAGGEGSNSGSSTNITNSQILVTIGSEEALQALQKKSSHESVRSAHVSNSAGQLIPSGSGSSLTSRLFGTPNRNQVMPDMFGVSPGDILHASSNVNTVAIGEESSLPRKWSAGGNDNAGDPRSRFGFTVMDALAEGEIKPSSPASGVDRRELRVVSPLGVANATENTNKVKSSRPSMFSFVMPKSSVKNSK